MDAKPSHENERAFLPTFHDDYLIAILLMPEKRCILVVQETTGALHTMVLLGVERLRADNFLEGNIILDASVRGGAAVSEDELLFALSMNENIANERSSAFRIWRERIRSQDLQLFQLSASYGCTLVSLCAGVFVDAVEDANLIHALRR